MKSLQIVKNRKENKAEKMSSVQKTFLSLKRKLENQRKEALEIKEELDDCLLYYHDSIRPTKKVLADSVKIFIPLVYKQYKNTKSWTWAQRGVIKDIILDDMRSLFQWTSREHFGDDILTIFEDLNGVSFDKAASDEADEVKEELQEMFKDRTGVDIDFSSINGTEDESEIVRKLFEALGSAAEDIQENFDKTSGEKKGKKQLDKERRLQEIEERQKQGIGSLYKRLAKAFHPDLESNAEQKVEKEKWMKRITQAYEESDIHTLLLLEMEWLDQSTHNGATYSDDQVKIYNDLLKKQIEEIKQDMRMLAIHPKYAILCEYISDPGFEGPSTLQRHHFQLRTKLAEYQSATEALQGANAKKVMKKLIDRSIIEREYREFLEFFEDPF